MQSDNGSLPQHKGVDSDTPQPGASYNFSRVLDTVQIPQVVYADRQLSPGARLLWGIIRRLGYKTGQCFATNARLADELGVNERQVIRYCRQLVAAKLLRETVHPGRAMIRELLWHERFNGAIKTPAPGSGPEGNNGRRHNDGNRKPPLTKMSPPTPDENVRGVLTDTSPPNLIGFSSGLLKATLPPPLAEPPPQSPAR